MSHVGILLHPLDVLFFRDGRPFDAGNRAQGGLPMPQTLAGMIRTLLWSETNFDKLANAFSAPDQRSAHDIIINTVDKPWARVAVRGPWLYSVDAFADKEKKSKIPVGPLIPQPADVVWIEDNFERRKPLSPNIDLPGWQPPTEAPHLRPFWLRKHGDSKASRQWLNSNGLQEYLHGKELHRHHFHDADCLFGYEDRTGIGVNFESQTADEGFLYTARFIRLKPGIVFYAEVKAPDATPDDLHRALHGKVRRWGGEGRHVRIEVLKQPHAWPAANTPSKDVALLLMTPGLFNGVHWLPDRLDSKSTRLCAALVSSAIPISGWDYALNRPKPARHAVPAGSVYCYTEFTPQPSNDPNDPFVHLCQDAELDAQGYGLALKGVFNYAE